jgi:hypothetical protein
MFIVVMCVPLCVVEKDNFKVVGEPLWLGGRMVENKRKKTKDPVFAPQPGQL